MIEAATTTGPATSVLRERTRAVHERVESLVDAHALLRDRAGYRSWLELMHAFHATADPALERAWPELPPSGRRERLHRELGALGATRAEIDALPVMDALPAGPGALYVVEGSALGAAVVGAWARRTLGVAGEAEPPARRWQSVRALIDGLGLAGERMQAALEEAHATFGAFEEWACR